MSTSRSFRATRFALLLAVLAVVSMPVSGDVAQVTRVVHVAAGDAFSVVLNGRRVRVRLAGIDAPESDQPYGSTAKKALARMVFGKAVRLQPVGQEAKTVIAYVRSAELEVNAELVRLGHAWAAPDGSSAVDFSALELRARYARRGLWAQDLRIAPWRWRDGQRSAKNASAYLP